MTEIKMPSAGQTTDEATIVAVHVKVGDTIKRGDVLCEAETDKAVLPVESFAAGTALAVLVHEGDTVTAGTVLVAVGKPGETYGAAPEAAAPAAPAAPVPAAEAPAAPVTEQDEYLPIIKGASVPAAPAAAPAAPSAHPAYPAMPNAKLAAREMGVDVGAVPAANGQFVTRTDVARYTPAAAAVETEYEVLPMSRMRQIIGKRMKESLSEIPCWQCTTSIKMDACMALRDTYKDKKGVKLS